MHVKYSLILSIIENLYGLIVPLNAKGARHVKYLISERTTLLKMHHFLFPSVHIPLFPIPLFPCVCGRDYPTFFPSPPPPLSPSSPAPPDEVMSFPDGEWRRFGTISKKDGRPKLKGKQALNFLDFLKTYTVLTRNYFLILRDSTNIGEATFVPHLLSSSTSGVILL